jgi:hypothetical protein
LISGFTWGFNGGFTGGFTGGLQRAGFTGRQPDLAG